MFVASVTARLPMLKTKDARGLVAHTWMFRERWGLYRGRVALASAKTRVQGGGSAAFCRFLVVGHVPDKFGCIPASRSL